MQYNQKEPSELLSQFIKLFWMIDSDNDATIRQDKIIPDGYPEMIFHFKDCYKSQINGKWEKQDKYLIAGQIRNYFLLENSGAVGMFAIKFQPYALTSLFGLNMALYTDRVLPIQNELLKLLTPVREISINNDSLEEKVEKIENWFFEYLKKNKKTVHPVELAISYIVESQGTISIEELINKINVSERTLERYFKKYIGLTPKFYSRIIRNAYIFKLVNQSKIDWSDISFSAGFYDQSHFIRDFKEFTGEEPTSYGFTKKNMANFFLNKN